MDSTERVAADDAAVDDMLRGRGAAHRWSGAHVYVCLCLAISDRVIRAAVTDGARTLEELEDSSGAGSVCGGCYAELQRLLDEGANEDGEGVPSTTRSR